MRANIIPVLFLTACASVSGPIDYDAAPPADWPRMADVVKRVQPGELERHCWAGLEAGANGCALADFKTRTCYIYTATDAPEVLEHERAHCRGYDHPGATMTRDAWQRFKNQKGTR